MRLVVAICLLFPAISLAAPKERVAMLGIGGGAGWDKATLVTVEELLLSALDATGGLSVIGQSDVARRLGYDNLRQALGCADDSECVAKTTGLLEARYVVAADLGKIGKTNLLTMKLMDTSSSEVVRRVAKPFESEDALFDVAHAVAGEIAAAVKERGTAGKAAVPVKEAGPVAAAPEWQARFADVQKPGFNCGARLNANEALICAEPKLAAADGALNALFKGLVAKMPAESVKALRTAQRGWIRGRDRTCAVAKEEDAAARSAAVECMERIVVRRIGDFLEMEAGLR